MNFAWAKEDITEWLSIDIIYGLICFWRENENINKCFLINEFILLRQIDECSIKCNNLSVYRMIQRGFSKTNYYYYACSLWEPFLSKRWSFRLTRGFSCRGDENTMIKEIDKLSYNHLKGFITTKVKVGGRKIFYDFEVIKRIRKKRRTAFMVFEDYRLSSCEKLWLFSYVIFL